MQGGVSVAPVRRMVGRADELERAGAALTESGFVTLLGPSGMGKSLLARELAAGRRTIFVVGSAALRDVPLGAMAHLRIGGEPASALGTAIDVLGAAEAIVVDEPMLLDPVTAFAVRCAHEHLGAPVVQLATSLGGLSPDLTALITAHPGTTVALRPLDAEECATLAAMVLGGGRLDGTSARQLAERSAGNPQLLIELIDEGRRSGTLAHRLGMWTWRGAIAPSASLRSLLSDRLDGLGAAQRDVVEVCALGERIPAELLARITDRAALDDVISAALVAVSDGPDATVQLAVPLLGDVVRAELNALRRRQIARRLLAGASDEPGTWIPDVRRAMWSLEAGLDAPDLYREGAAAALAQLSLDAATALAGALRRAGKDPAYVATVLATIGRYDEAVSVLDGVEHDADSGTTVRRAINLMLRDGEGAAATEVLADADDPDAEIAATRAWVELFDGAVPRATATARSVLVRPGASGAAVVWAAVAGITAGALGDDSTFVPSAEQRARALIDDANLSSLHPFSELQLDMSVVAWHILTLDPVGGLELASERYRAAQLQSPFLAGAWAGFVGWAAKESGDLRLAAERLSESVTALGPADPFGLGSYAATELSAAVAMSGGDPGELPTVTQGVFAALSLRNEAWVHAARGDVLRSRSLLLRAGREARTRGHHAVAALAELDLSRWCGRRCDPVELLRWDESDHAGLRRVATLVRGFEAAAAKRPTARDTLAIAAARQEARRGGLTIVELELGGGPSSVIGEEVRSPAITTAARSVMGLTRRETEIARLSATGRPSREIADALGVSVRTVDNHLGRIYAKLGIARREDLRPLFAAEDPPNGPSTRSGRSATGRPRSSTATSPSRRR